MKLIRELDLLFILLLLNLRGSRGQNTTEMKLSNPTNESSTNVEYKSCNFSSPKGISTLRPVVERIFTRRKRFLLAPPKTRLKFTLSMSKQMLATVPSGFNFNIELAVYYPMITSRLDLIPKRLRPSTTPKPKPKGPTTPLIIQIPGSLIRYKAKPATKPPKVQRIDDLTDGQTLQWVDTKPVVAIPEAAQYYTQPLNWQKWSKYGAPDYAQRYEWAPEKQWLNKQPAWLAEEHKWSKWTTTPLPWTVGQKVQQQKLDKWQRWQNPKSGAKTWAQQSSRWHRDTSVESEETINENFQSESNEVRRSASNLFDGLDELDEIEPMYAHFPELEGHHEWKHYHNYRDRRQLYHQLDGLSGILGIDMKSCVLRAICDCKRFLLPPGYSMVQDILRLMFSFPTKSGIQDEYSRIVQTNYEKCDLQLKSACPFNMLAWLMGQMRS